MQREVLSDDKSEKGLWLISTNFPLIQGLVKFISQLITDFQNQLKSTIKVKRCFFALNEYPNDHESINLS